MFLWANAAIREFSVDCYLAMAPELPAENEKGTWMGGGLARGLN